MLLPGTHYVVYATNYMYVWYIFCTLCTDMNRVHVMCTTGVSCTVATHICILKITGALNIVTFCSRVDLVKV